MSQSDNLAIQSPVTPNIEEDEWNEKYVEQYDRQLRLWGVRGQEGLTNAKVLLLGGTATGAEVLKNLILPGIGEFTIVDNARVTAADFGSNFFVNKSALGQSRAKVVTELLNELNSESTVGGYIEEDPRSIADSRPELFRNYTFVIGAQLESGVAAKVGRVCAAAGIPLLLARSYGLVGSLRLYHHCHEVIEGKLDNEVEDLRISSPWPELHQWAVQENLASMDRSIADHRKAHSHIPYLAILIQLLDQWKAAHNGNLPANLAEKRQFKALITASSWDMNNELNFTEALAKVFQAYTPAKVPEEVQAIFDDERCTALSADSSAFWICAAAVKRFVNTASEGNGQLPLPGSLPDMHGDTDRYIVLQSLFRRKARADRNAVKEHVLALLAQLGRRPDSIPDVDISEFTKNVYALRVYHYKSIDQELLPATTNTAVLAKELADAQSPIIFYLLLRAVDRFAEQHGGAFPGSSGAADIEGDVAALRSVVALLLTELALPAALLPGIEDHIREMVRYGAAELHNIAALIGGVGAQEVIKILTAQRVPLVNTWIYWGAPCVAKNFVA